jgi:hypothetical protein
MCAASLRRSAVSGVNSGARNEAITVRHVGRRLNVWRKHLLAAEAVVGLALPVTTNARGQVPEPSFDVADPGVSFR